MATQIMIPSALRRFVGARDSVQVEAGTVGEALARLVAEYRDSQAPLRRAGPPAQLRERT
jgi:hypothetical protein